MIRPFKCDDIKAYNGPLDKDVVVDCWITPGDIIWIRGIDLDDREY